MMSGITMSPIRYRHMSKIHSGLHGVKLIKVMVDGNLNQERHK